jgi:SAM-dependent methyltransferase
VTDRLYWYGNAAKIEIIDEILAAANGRAITVFDYGCGDAGDWPQILRDHPNVRLIGYEPGSNARAAAERLQGLDARIYSGNEIETLEGPADYIVSFSVFEHVYDRPAYLRHARRILAPGGTFMLNYDDGHFRNVVDLARLREAIPEVRSRMHNVLQPLLGAAGMRGNYQRRVARKDADALIASAGFRVDREAYHNVRSLKLLARGIAEEKRQEFARFWVGVEQELNRRFLDRSKETMGDDANLWREMMSRTLWLRHR